MRAASASGVSLERTGTASWATIGPESSPSSTRCTVAPLTFTPWSQARRWASSPGNAGRRAGWTLRIRPGKARTKTGERRRMKPARHTRSTWRARRVSTTSASKTSRVFPRWSQKTAGRPAWRARSRPRAPSTFDTTTAISPPSSPRRAASMRAWRFDPRPLTRTPTLFTPASLPGDAGAGDHRPDHEARLPAPLERVLDLVEVARGDDHHHADPHVEGALHLLGGDG